LVIDDALHGGLLPDLRASRRSSEYVYTAASRRRKNRALADLQDIVRKGR
jgi:hypothetical protein